jgi:hypothetical protein
MAVLAAERNQLSGTLRSDGISINFIVVEPRVDSISEFPI